MPPFDAERPLFLAPMASLSHRPLRTLIEGFGHCDYYFTEMASVGAIRANAPFERFYLDTEPRPERTIVQLVGSSRDDFLAACRIVENRDAWGIDVNMGCSAPEIVRQNAGIAWMKDERHARSLVEALREVVKTKRLSVKIRIGWDDDPDRLVSFCRAMEAEGVDFITLHPRLKADKLSRPPKWERFRSVKEAIAIPLVANGDAFLPADVSRLFSAQGADGVMIGRAAVQKPWIFRDTRRAEAGMGAATEGPTLEETAFAFIELLERHLPQEFHETRLRRFFLYYCDNFRFGHHPKMRMKHAKTGAEFREILSDYFADAEDERSKIP